MRRIGCCILVSLMLLSPLKAQDWGRVNELTYDAEYFFMTKQYDKAIRAYSQILQQLPDNANIKYKLGVCYLNTDKEKEKAIQYFNEATKNISPDYNPSSYKEEAAPLETYFLLGSAYRVNNQLDNASRSYRDYIDNLSSKDTKQKQIAEHYLQSCRNAAEMMANPVNISNSNLGNIINDETSDFNAVFSADGRIVVYTSLKRDVNNIMYAENIDGVWTKPKVITRQITSKNNFKPTYISPDGTVLYLVEEDPFNSEIYFSTLNRGRWTTAVKLKKPINSKMNETHASLSPDGKTIYFTSDRSGGEGDLDIYYSNLDEKDKWGKPVNMGPKINTIYNEETPFVSPDGNLLYFSSEGHEGMGGYDIYYFDLHKTGAEAVNMGYPINTTDNDLFYFPGINKYRGYYAHLSADGYGDKDIYALEIHPEVLIKGELIPDNYPSFIDTGRLLISIMDPETYNTLAWIKPSDVSGSFNYKLTPGNYLLSVNAPDYELFTKEINIDPDPSYKEMKINANLIYTGAPVASVNVYDSSVADMQVADASAEIHHEANAIVKEESLSVTESTPVEPEITEPAAPYVTEEPQIQDNVTKEFPSKPVIYSTPVSEAADWDYAFIDEVVNELNDISSIPTGTPVTYTVQLFALSKPVDLSYFRNLENIAVQLAPDNLYKYTWGIVNTMNEAKALCKEVLDRGYRDVIIRRRSIVPEYTIQVMAGKAPVNFKYFGKLDRLKVSLGKDGYYRYTFGEYENMDDAREDLTRVKSLGYRSAFVKKL